MVKELSDGVNRNAKYCKNFDRNSLHWRKLSMIMVWEHYCSMFSRFSKIRILFIFFVYIFIHISANMSPFGLKFSQMILHTETSKLMYNWSFLFVVLHKPTLLPSTFKVYSSSCEPNYYSFLAFMVVFMTHIIYRMLLSLKAWTYNILHLQWSKLNSTLKPHALDIHRWCHTNAELS